MGQTSVLLDTGFRVGDYEVIAPIAAGGMGEVYRARDTVLRRDVALKILTRAGGYDPERQARFEREARAVAALSHPNILAIYSFGYVDGLAYAAMEWLDGHTLRHELGDGPLPVRRVIDLGPQMALGLSAAHQKGVVHRDLKPENVLITPDGMVKLLDFGLARIASDSPSSATTSDGESITNAGMLLGTAGYMSPEQVSGSIADHRADVFSLGAVLFEMLTGQLPFRGESAVATWTATLTEAAPPISALTAGVPSSLERIVMRCLEKSPAERFQSARDLAFAISALTTPAIAVAPPADASPGSAGRNRRRVVAAIAAAICLLAVAIAWGRHAVAVVPRQDVVAFTITPAAGTTLANVPSRMLAISPHGERIVFAVTKAGHRELWIRELASTDSKPLPGTENATEPFWSPDGQHVGFFADSKLKRVSVDGGPVTVLADAPIEVRGATWNEQGTILFSDAFGGLSRVTATGGAPTRVTRPDREQTQENDSWPQFLPDGRRFLYLRHGGPSIEAGGKAYLGALDEAAGRELLAGVFNALFVPPNSLVFTDTSGIKVQRIDLDRGQMKGDIEEVPADVDRHRGHAALAVSRNGTLTYAVASSRDHRLAWVDRSGRETGVAASPDGWRDVALSPDGSHAAVQRIVPDANDIWIIDLVRGVPSRFTFSPEVDDDPVWSPDGTKIAFSSVRNGVPGVYQKVLGGAGGDELLFTNRGPIHPSAWSPDGRFLLFEQTAPESASDVWVLPTQGDRTPYAYIATAFSEADAHFSPDGKWVAYTSNESGRNEIYVQSFPDLHEKVQVSLNGGVAARWAPSGRELYFISVEGRLMAVKINLAESLKVGAPIALFDTSLGLGTNRYVPNHDGTRFLLNISTPESRAAHLVVVLNWIDHLGITQATR